MTALGMVIHDGGSDGEAELAAGALARLLSERQIARLRTWLETRASYPRRWRRAAGLSELSFYLTAQELEELNEEITALLLARFIDRRTDPTKRPVGSIPVEVLVFSYPIAPPPPK